MRSRSRTKSSSPSEGESVGPWLGYFVRDGELAENVYNTHMITIDDFKKVELKVGRVVTAEPIEGSDKLLKLRVDLGSDPASSSGQDIRQILSGIAKYYQPADLVGKLITVIVNLEPRMMMGLESQGMVLAAGDGETVSLLVPDKDMPAGSSIR